MLQRKSLLVLILTYDDVLTRPAAVSVGGVLVHAGNLGVPPHHPVCGVVEFFFWLFCVYKVLVGFKILYFEM